MYYHYNENLFMPLKVLESFTNSTFSISSWMVYTLKRRVIIYYVYPFTVPLQTTLMAKESQVTG